MNKTLIILIFLLLMGRVSSSQLRPYVFKGGWMSCDYANDDLALNRNVSIYFVTLNLYGTVDFKDVFLRIWDAATGAPVSNLDNIPIDPYGESRTNHFSACPNTASLNNRYRITYKEYTVVLPINPNGYFLTISLRGRDSGIVNIYDPEYTGILFTANIPGTQDGIDYRKNSTPLFVLTDTVTTCRNTPFTFLVSATDKDGDSLSYSFGEAIEAATDTTSPPLVPVKYNPPFSGTQPMGNDVAINHVTGLVSGIAPDVAGGYTIAVYVQEWRKGVLINTSKKESQIKVVNCPFAAPLLKPLYSSCRNYTFNFKNEPTCPGITSWFWDFGLPGSTTDTSTLARPSFTYPSVPGTYTLKLKVANNDGYVDSAASIVKILDAVNVKIAADTAICKTDSIILRPVTEATGFVWRETGGGNTLSNYTVQYPKASPVADVTTYFVNARLDGCRDSTSITVYASLYPIAKAGADTVICIGGRVTLNATVSGAYYTWSPSNTLFGSNSLQPVAIPQKTTKYILSVRDTLYCPKPVNDTVTVKVIPTFSVDAGKDAYIVTGQPYQLSARSGGNTEIVSYAWQPSAYLNNSTLQNPVATIIAGSVGTIPFIVKATTVVGNCSAVDEVLLKVFKTGPEILLPTAFTPNNDGRNDVLKPILIGMGKLAFFSVYNRFGQAIYTTAEAAKGWDGTVQGIPQSGGVYIIVASGKDYLGRQVFKKGTVFLMR